MLNQHYLNIDHKNKDILLLKDEYTLVCSIKEDHIPDNYILYDINFEEGLGECTKIFRKVGNINGPGNYIIKKNQETVKEYDNVNAYSLTYSPDNKQFVFTVGKNGEQFIVHNGVEGDKYDWIYSITFSPDSKRLAYAAKKGNRRIVVLDGKEVQEDKNYNSVLSLTFSPDSKRFAYAVGVGYGESVVLDGKEEKQYRSVHSLAFSSDSRNFYYMAGGYGKYNPITVITGGKIISKKDIYQKPVSSSDDKHSAYIVEEDEWQFVVLDGKEQKKYASIYSLTFSSNGKHLAYVAKLAKEDKKDNKYIVVLDGVESEKYDEYNNGNLTYSPISKITFSSDGNHLAYTVQSYIGKSCPRDYFVVLDGKKELRIADNRIYKDCLAKNCDSCKFTEDLIFSSDGKYFAFVSSEKDSYSIIKLNEFQDMNDIYKTSIIDNKKISAGSTSSSKIQDFTFSEDNKSVMFYIIFDSGEVYYAKEFIK